MPLVKYIGNSHPGDGASRLKLADGDNGQERVLVLNGEPLEVTDAEFGELRGGFQIEEVNSEEAPDVSPPSTPSVGTTPSQSSPATPSASGFSTTPSTPVSGS